LGANTADGVVPQGHDAGLTARHLKPRTATADQLLGLAPGEAVNELLALRRHAEQTLLPVLATRKGEWALGPTFAGSRLMNADADLIAAGLLLELKTSLGDKRANGARRASLERQTLLQLFGYLLLDPTDEFAIAEVGVQRPLRTPGHLAAPRAARST